MTGVEGARERGQEVKVKQRRILPTDAVPRASGWLRGQTLHGAWSSGCRSHTKIVLPSLTSFLPQNFLGASGPPGGWSPVPPHGYCSIEHSSDLELGAF